jgi:photosystem II stability/assembly factor-like uncharacterized protein
MADGWLQDIYFIDLNNGYAVGHHSSGADWYGTILRTTNGGLVWTSIASETHTILHSVKFTDLSSGWIVGGRVDYGERAVVLKTTNAGIDWSKEILNSNQGFKAISFRNNNVGTLVGEFGRIFCSNDGGNTWISPPAGSAINWTDAYFTNEDNGILVGEFGFIWRTTNGGQTWVHQSSGTSNHLNDVCFKSSSKGWAVGDSGTILKTTNGGVTWLQQSSGTSAHLNSVCFIDEDTGLVCGTIDNVFQNVIIKTINGGLSWVPQPTDSFPSPIYYYSQLKSIFFVNNNVGWIIYARSGGAGGTLRTSIYKTIDGGLTWNLKLLVAGGDAELGLNKLLFINHNYGIVVGGSGRSNGGGIIFKTADGGEMWTEQIFPETREFRDVFLNNASLGMVVGDEGKILRTMDSGENWIEQTSGTINSLKGVHFVNELIGWVVGDNGTILHTTNGGVSFIEEEQIDEMPSEFLLSNNYPNPFNPSTKIQYSVPQSSNVVIKVFDIGGNEIETLINEEKPAGTYELTWNAALLPSGVYFYQLKAGEFVSTKKMILLK